MIFTCLTDLIFIGNMSYQVLLSSTESESDNIVTVLLISLYKLFFIVLVLVKGDILCEDRVLLSLLLVLKSSLFILTELSGFGFFLFN